MSETMLYNACLYQSSIEETLENLGNVVEQYSSSFPFTAILQDKDVEVTDETLRTFAIVTIFYNFFNSVQLSDREYSRISLNKEFVSKVVSAMQLIDPNHFTEMAFTTREKDMLIDIMYDLVKGNY